MGHIFITGFNTFKKSEVTDKKSGFISHLVVAVSIEYGRNTTLYLGNEQYTVANTLETLSHAEVCSVI
jgi:hypothetical protein